VWVNYPTSKNPIRYQKETLRGWTVKRRRKSKCEIHDPPRIIEEDIQEIQESWETVAKEELWICKEIAVEEVYEDGPRNLEAAEIPWDSSQAWKRTFRHNQISPYSSIWKSLRRGEIVLYITGRGKYCFKNVVKCAGNNPLVSQRQDGEGVS
jgi:hypothetical protein